MHDILYQRLSKKQQAITAVGASCTVPNVEVSTEKGYEMLLAYFIKILNFCIAPGHKIEVRKVPNIYRHRVSCGFSGGLNSLLPDI